jgi:hypothetical protein
MADLNTILRNYQASDEVKKHQAEQLRWMAIIENPNTSEREKDYYRERLGLKEGMWKRYTRLEQDLQKQNEITAMNMTKKFLDQQIADQIEMGRRTRENAMNNFIPQLEKMQNDPQWLYTNWSWDRWPGSARQYWIDEWKRSHKYNYTQLFDALLKDEYQSEWHYINNYLSWSSDIPALPDPNSELFKVETDTIHTFYEDRVPYAGALIKWYKQMPSSLVSLSENAEWGWKINTRAFDKWFSLVTKKVESRIPTVPTLAGFGTLAVAGIAGIAVIAVATRK